MDDRLFARRDRVAALLKLIAITILATVVAFGLLVYTAARQAEIDATPVLEKQGIAVAQSVRASLEHALSLGIPLREVRGVSEYFGRLLQEYADLRFIAVVNPNGKILFYEGMGRLRLGRLISQEEVQDIVRSIGTEALTADGSTVVSGDFAVSVLPIGAPQDPEALLYVSVQRSEVTRALMVQSWDVLAVFLLAVLATFQVARAALDGMVWLPLAQLRRRFEAAAGGRFEALPEASGNDEVAGLIGRYNRAVFRLGERQDMFNLNADEVASGAWEYETRSLAVSLAAELNQQIVISTDAARTGMGLNAAAAIRLPAFFTGCAIGVALGVQGAVSFRGIGWLPLDGAGAAAILAWLVASAIAFAVPRRRGALAARIAGLALIAVLIAKTFEVAHPYSLSALAVVGACAGFAIGSLWQAAGGAGWPTMAKAAAWPTLSGLLGGGLWAWTIELDIVAFNPTVVGAAFAALGTLFLFTAMPATES